MSQALLELERRIQSAEDLHGVVRTMKTMAAVNIRQYERSLNSLDDYYRTVEMGLQAVLRDRPLSRSDQGPQQTLLLLFGSGQGMVGRFNELILDEVETVYRQQQEEGRRCPVWVVGEKAASGMAQRMEEPGEIFRPPSSAQAITGVVQQILLQFEAWRRQHGETRLLLFHNAPAEATQYQQRQINLLPPDDRWLATMSGQPWPGRCLPLHDPPWQALFSNLIAEYLFVSLFRGFAASLTAENAARLAAMQRAEKNIEEMRDAFQSDYHALRQNSVTEELFDVITGFEALVSGREGGSR